ncbi:hypothetical protein BS47DRAFT_1325097 [Hydnum rufescens UP504]|uniref:Major facilitator superfamily (MFS) profile domain-containing protein n=1 Tax=Hydnum rufescens UP504 TaxID=1448309 RepID=A0A9P6B760_9AGAM|nr:hypothetical protein BS47DRAFT_1325097 [Hydnum rufescens UP504]
MDTPLPPADEIYFPEGGLRAWSVVFGVIILIGTSHSSFGFVNAWVFQEYYARTLLKDQSQGTIAWIGSTQYALVYLPCLVSGRLLDIGYLRAPLLVASVSLVFCLFMTAQCTQYWQFMLSQGVTLGIVSGFVFGPALPIVTHYFYKRRAIVYGIVALGASTGGTVLAIAVRKLLPRVGFPWTMRITALIFIATTGTANITLRRRLPPKNVKGGLFNLPAFRSMPYTLYTASMCVGLLGIYTVLTYIDTMAVGLGINPEMSFYLVAIANAASAVGRFVPCLAANRLGAVNLLIIFTFIAAVMTIAWPFAKTFGNLLAISIVYGASTGAYMSLMALPVAKPSMGGQGDIGRRTGMVFTVCSIGALCGPPISGLIEARTGGYIAVGYYAGSVTILACILMFACKIVATGRVAGSF